MEIGKNLAESFSPESPLPVILIYILFALTPLNVMFFVIAGAASFAYVKITRFWDESFLHKAHFIYQKRTFRFFIKLIIVLILIALIFSAISLIFTNASVNTNVLTAITLESTGFSSVTAYLKVVNTLSALFWVKFFLAYWVAIRAFIGLAVFELGERP